MGMNAEILAIGPYSHDVIDALEYDAHRYEGTPTGTTIVTQVIVCPGSTTSRELAKACGIDAWNFAKHKLDVAFVDVEALEEFSKSIGEPGAGKAFKALADASFTFFFLPNG